jgi:hypothetical protein
MAMKARFFLLFSLLAAPLASCSVPSANDLEVAARVEDSSLQVAPSAFSTPANPQGILTGTFTLTLSLGELASKGTDVTIESFALVSAADQSALIAPVEVGASDPKVATVNIGETQKLVYHVAFDNKPQPLAKLCAAKSVQYTGTIIDTAQNKTTPVVGPSFQIQGCP